MNGKMRELGGFAHASASDVVETDDGWLVNVPVVILDDHSFLEYCVQIGAEPGLDGAVILNRIRDVSNPDFRNPQYYPYIKDGEKTSILRRADETGAAGKDAQAEVSVIAYTQEVPALREEYAALDYYELVHFMPVSLWSKIQGQIGGAQEDMYVRILAEEGAGLKEFEQMEDSLAQAVGLEYDVEIENRIQEKLSNDEMIDGMMLILGGLCVLLAMIGIGNVFSNTLGFVWQRKREFARYMSVGMTMEGIRKMCWIEALVTAVRPLLVTLPLTVAATGIMIKASYLDPMVFIRQMPVVPVLLFVLGDFLFVGLAYFLGWRRVSRMQIVDVLRDDTMM